MKANIISTIILILFLQTFMLIGCSKNAESKSAEKNRRMNIIEIKNYLKKI